MSDLALKICSHCGASFELATKYIRCPHCGNDLERKNYNTITRRVHGSKECRVTPKQKQIMKILFDGGYLRRWYWEKFRVYDRDGIARHKLSEKGFASIEKYLKQVTRRRSNVWMISKKNVRSMRPNTWVRQYYQTLNKKS